MEFPRINDKLAFFDFDETMICHTHSRDYYRDIQGELFQGMSLHAHGNGPGT